MPDRRQQCPEKKWEEFKMNKVAVVYWSGTGNTQTMAEKVEAGAKQAGAETALFEAADFDGSMLDRFDAVAFGCPSMGSEQLEPDVFEPMFSGCAGGLKGKKIALFGSYGWGDGEWMRNWEDVCISAGALLVCASVICNESPGEAEKNACEKMGKALAA